MVHDVINSIQLSSFDLFSSKIDFQAPQYKILLVIFRLLKKHIDDILNAGRYG